MDGAELDITPVDGASPARRRPAARPGGGPSTRRSTRAGPRPVRALGRDGLPHQQVTSPTASSRTRTGGSERSTGRSAAQSWTPGGIVRRGRAASSLRAVPLEPQPLQASRGLGTDSSATIGSGSGRVLARAVRCRSRAHPAIVQRSGGRRAPALPWRDAPDDVRLTAFVRGEVQGVGFRWWTRARALELGLAGFASNLPDGRVQVVAEGPRRSLRAAARAAGRAAVVPRPSG